MIIEYNLPNCFVPEEQEFQIYCAIKLLKRNYINKDEALNMCGCSKDVFEKLYSSFEKRYKKICGRSYTDWEFEEDPKER